jgi:hypothetical protein
MYRGAGYRADEGLKESCLLDLLNNSAHKCDPVVALLLLRAGLLTLLLAASRGKCMCDSDLHSLSLLCNLLRLRWGAGGGNTSWLPLIEC